MKTSKDPRHIYRKKLIKYLFAESFAHQTKVPEEVEKVVSKIPELDKEIEKAATAWPIDKINKVDLAILRLAVYELSENQIPKKVIIDEAVEIAKEYGSETSSSFINGVLGTIYEDKNE